MPKKDVFTEQRYAKRKIEELASQEAEALENLPHSIIEQFQKKRVKLLAGISPEARKSLVAMGVVDEVLANRAQAHSEQTGPTPATHEGS